MAKKFSKDKNPWGGIDPDTGEVLYKASKPSCYESHKGLKLVGMDGTGATIYGGSCAYPTVKDADIYIGFDKWSMSYQSPVYPWKPQKVEVVEFLFPITDMAAPSNAAEFKEMIDWVCNQLHTGKKIHAGCIGGHGRTGTFLAAVVSQFMGVKDAITYVRENYCHKAVESAVQVAFLAKHYGVTPVSGAKASLVPANRGWSAMGSINSTPSTGLWDASNARAASSTSKIVTFPSSKRSIAPVPSKRNVW